LQRASLSVACNLVEGSSRQSLKEYRHFVSTALASAREAEYLIRVATELSYLPAAASEECRTCCVSVVASLQNLLTALDKLAPRGERAPGL